jgi:hypothetical protein
MKRIFTIAAVLIMTATVWAQIPEKMSYQAVVRNSGNALVATQAVGMQISILQGGATGTVVYVEKQSPTTNANGLVSLEIGTGTVVSGNFTTIDWANGTYFIKTETDPTGGTSYTITGTSQLMSVPYALYAKTSGSSTPGPQGSIGAAGTNGINGIDGATGVAGTNGTNGIDGAIGAAGTNGAAGATGAAGNDGATGTNGVDGAAGATGAAGTNGTNGIDGATGAIGAAGNDGAIGTNGTNGVDGAAGAIGAAGTNGIDGATGAAGTNGTNGIDGATGAIGAAGNDGATGTNGVDGAAGATGAAGTNGTNGIDGAIGAAGTNGAAGATGAAGNDGATGTNGTNGIDGAIGTAGTNGAAGATGAAGNDGAAGAAGTNGINGTNGNDGATGATGATGPFGVVGTTGQTIYHDGTDWAASSNIFNADSNVGIGTVTPGEKMAIEGNLLLTQGAARSIYVEENTNSSFSIGDDLTLAAGKGADGGGNLILKGGEAGGFGNPGKILVGSTIADLTAGTGITIIPQSGAFGSGVTGTGSDVTITGGQGAGGSLVNGTGGNLILSGGQGAFGSSVTGTGGDLMLSGGQGAFGSGSSGTGGNVVVSSGQGTVANGYISMNINTSEMLRITNTGNVGIGETNPGAKLEVAGQVKITGGTPGTGKVLTSDANGLATWASTASLVGPTGAAGADGGVGPFHLGKDTLGGIVYYIYFGSDGNQHGLIVNKTESTAAWQAIGTLTNANRTEDGAFNTALMTSSAAATYVTGLGAGWYLPSIDELNLLFNNRFSSNKALRAGGFTLLSNTAVYWSSTENGTTNAVNFNFYNTPTTNYNKNIARSVRAVRAF